MSSIILFREVHHVVEKSLAFPHMLNLLSKALDFVPSLLIQSTCVNHGLHNLLANVSRYNVINVALALLNFFSFFFFFLLHRSLQDLISLTRNQNWVHCSGSVGS